MQSVGLVLTPPLAGPEKAARATSPTPPGEGRENARNQIPSLTAGILLSALPRAARFREKQTNAPSPPLLSPASTHGRRAVTRDRAPPAAHQCCGGIVQDSRSRNWVRFLAGATQPLHGVCLWLPSASLSSRQGQGKDKLQQKAHLFFRTKLARFGTVRAEKGAPVGNEDSSVCCGGKMVASHFSRVPRVLTTALHKSKSLERDFLLSSHPPH